MKDTDFLNIIIVVEKGITEASTNISYWWNDETDDTKKDCIA